MDTGNSRRFSTAPAAGTSPAKQGHPNLEGAPSRYQTPLIAAIVPAHDEEARIGSCIASLLVAARCPLLQGEQVVIVVILDACSDGTGDIARSLGVEVVTADGRNVGAARALGAQHALALGARWLAFTDADTEVGPGWFSAQLALGGDAVCGTIAVRDWESYGEPMRIHFDATYTDADGHRHIHGANLGVSALAYRHAGGFCPLESSEDVALVRALEQTGASIVWSAAPRVFTSARKSYRAPGGFGECLVRAQAKLLAVAVDEVTADEMPT
ncbi:glycosyltransferase [soil metagenome]